jgi:hypothetical protein
MKVWIKTSDIQQNFKEDSSGELYISFFKPKEPDLFAEYRVSPTQKRLTKTTGLLWLSKYSLEMISHSHPSEGKALGLNKAPTTTYGQGWLQFKKVKGQQ